MPRDEFGREIPAPLGHHHHQQHRPPPEEAPTPRKSQHPAAILSEVVVSGTNNSNNEPLAATAVPDGTTSSSTIVNNNNPATPPAVERRPFGRRLPPQYPAFVYTEKALPCEYLYKEQQQEEQQAAAAAATTTTTTTNDEALIVMPPYEEYRKSYCLNYVRMFFNEHLDDSWFRRRYSSLFRYQDVVQEQERASREAESLLQKLQQQRASAASLSSILDEFQLTGAKQLASGHWFAFQQKNKDNAAGSTTTTTDTMAILVTDIPTHLTDEQLLAALDNGSATSTTSSSSSNKQTLQIHHVLEKTPYRNRSVIVVGPKRLIESSVVGLQRSVNNNNNNNNPTTTAATTTEFTFECSTDPYNRTCIDADGQGGATADGRRVPMRTVTVKVATVVPPHAATVLSATLSTPARFAKDLATATQLANVLDQSQNIPTACNLQALLSLVLSMSNRNDNASGEQQQQDPDDKDPKNAAASIEQQLDLAVAYLRRVHLRNFYHQPDVPHTFAQMLLSPMYVRMKIVADTLNLDVLSDDLLAKRLDDGLARALQSAKDLASEVKETLRQEAETIERDIAETELEWIRAHTIAQTKGRARCSFHFCKKLFQDDSFLKKHLHKKHIEYLLAEQAKCHDKSMMKAWDEARVRPVPEIMVDCGSKFGLVPVRLLEGGVPDVEDPEPRLWKEEEERVASMQRRREEGRKQQHHNHQQLQQQHQPPTVARRVFVDVDDMQEEKVELTFDPAVATIPPKKKKKRKLL